MKWVRLTRYAFADCIRCGAPAWPTDGYCGRFCREADAYDEAQAERLAEHTLVCRRPGSEARIMNLAPPTAESRAAFARAFDAMDEDTIAALRATFGGDVFR